MKNTEIYRYFLVCNKLANDILGMQPQNFAQLIVEENLGRFMNSQMTRIFNQVNYTLSEIIANDESILWEELDIDEVAEISVEQLEEDYNNYVLGNMRLTLTNE